MKLSESFDKKFVSKLATQFSFTKKQSPYSKISLFRDFSPESPINHEHSITRKKGTPIFWDIKDEDIKTIKSRSRLEDFNNDSLSKLFPRKSPTFNKKSNLVLPPLNTSKFFNKKLDSTTIYRESIFKLQNQGFLKKKLK